ncbi:HAD-IB family phosphatase [Rhodococcus sp. IEGM 1381]|uniref:HAD family hydrolase n=1 Tax=Rhodococcus sp. IEGM 1381 TaxID=3047085 RepID=UPI0024B84820|nr:HAD-IB family phosphatase [Rhodococcus sp. IEGM 1381]MDI9896358.1 HAD-IB family phosphatase [Rhodococcus sp. IEGM 1381]
MTTRGIVFFDIDGTLVPSMSSGSFLASRFGHQRELDRAERLYATGELTNEEVSVIDAEGWRGVSTRTVERWLDDLPLIAGVEEVMSWCRSHRIEPTLASLAWQPVSNSIARRYGFTANGGPRVGISEFVYDGTVAEHFDEYDKRDRALALAAERRIPVQQCCAIGDSRSDVPLFEVLPASLALNAGPAAREAATAAIAAQDLTAVIPWLEEWERELGRP